LYFYKPKQRTSLSSNNTM